MFGWLTRLFSSEETLVLTKEMEVKEKKPKKKTVAKKKSPAKKTAGKKIVAEKKATKK